MSALGSAQEAPATQFLLGQCGKWTAGITADRQSYLWIRASPVLSEISAALRVFTRAVSQTRTPA